jgi:hypothetical protein
MSRTEITIPAPCRGCNSLKKGEIKDAAVVCTACGTHCARLSGTTLAVLADIARLFGNPTAIVLRCGSSAREAIKQQDLWLKTHFASGGRSQYQIITDAIEGSSAPDEVDDDEPVE